MLHIPGIGHRAADCVSRHPTSEPEKLFLEDDVAAVQSSTTDITHSHGLMSGLRTPAAGLAFVEEPVIASAVSTLDALSLRSVIWERVQTATTSDNNMQALITLI
jgi:hypothetical protein